MSTIIDSRVRVLDHYTEVFRDRARRYEDDGDPYFRGVVATQVYRDHPDMPITLKKAEVMARTLESIEIKVIDESLLAGSIYRKLRVHNHVSDDEGWRRFALYPDLLQFDPDLPAPPHVKKLYEFWRAKGITWANNKNRHRIENLWLWKYGIAHPFGFANGHTLPDHGILLGAGIAALRDRLKSNIAAAAGHSATQFAAMDRCLEGLSRHIKRCAEVTAERSRMVSDPEIARRLDAVADNCRHIAVNAPDTFSQALQLVFFSNFADKMDNSGDAASFGRLDQLLYPYYLADVEADRLDRHQGFDWICHFLIKIWANQESKNITIGGVDSDGRDATNDLSHLFVEAMAATEMVCDLTARIHSDTENEFLSGLARVLRRDFGRPSLYNDDVTIPALVSHGVELVDARDYAPLGCVEVMIPGRSAGRTMCMGMNHLKVLELVLNRGTCLVTGDSVWTDVPETYQTYDELINVYHAKIREIVSLGAAIINEDERLEPAVRPRPWLTVLSRNGIDDGRDMTAGQPKYDPVGVTMNGIADIANSLYAVRKLVFDERSLTLEKLRQILKDNFAGHEDLWKLIVNGMPRYGQDVDQINKIVAEETRVYALAFQNLRTEYGGRFMPMIFGVITGLMNGPGPKTGASVSGRLAGEAPAQSLQPSPIGPRGGATEILRSAAAIDYRLFPGGVSNVQDFDPVIASGEEGIVTLKSLIEGFFALGGMELSMNFIRLEKIREAQKHPDRYPFLMVRLFGMSARFILLSPELQELVIQRMDAARQRQF